MKDIELSLTPDEAQYIVNALSLRPFNEVFQLIAKIKQQADGQLQAPEAPAEPEA